MSIKSDHGESPGNYEQILACLSNISCHMAIPQAHPCGGASTRGVPMDHFAAVLLLSVFRLRITAAL